MTHHSRTRPVTAVAAAALLALAGCSTDNDTGSTDDHTSASETTNPNSTPTPPAETSKPHHTRSPSPSPSATPRGTQPGKPVDTSDPDSVAKTYAILVNSYDTRLDKTGYGAEYRAKKLLTKTNRETLKSVTPNPGSNSTWWTRMARHDGYTIVKLERNYDTGPKDSKESAARSYVVTRKPRNDDGWQGSPDRVVDYITMTHTPDGWRVADTKAQPTQ